LAFSASRASMCLRSILLWTAPVRSKARGPKARVSPHGRSAA
jgi:hypothetical protein